MEETPQIEQSTKSTPKLGKFSLTGCSILIAIIIIGLVIALGAISRDQDFKDFTACATRIQSVGAALDRYYTKNDKYPDKLTDLVPDYIKSSELYCPNDKTKEFTYKKPDVDAPGKTVVLSSSDHKILKGSPLYTIVYLKDGTVTVANPKSK